MDFKENKNKEKKRANEANTWSDFEMIITMLALSKLSFFRIGQEVLFNSSKFESKWLLSNCFKEERKAKLIVETIKET